jgi:hypothetical protein
MTRCPKCGAEIDDMDEVCPGCMAKPPLSPADGYAGPWQSTAMDCDACGYKWAAVHPVVAEYLECPVCHHMTPAPYVES